MSMVRAGDDTLGSLRHVTLPGGTEIEYIVDGLGRRVGKKVGGALVKGWLWGDALRSVAEHDGAGAVVARFDTSPGFQPFGYAGGLYDPDTGLVRFGARDYDPEVGRWTAKDPLLFGGGDTNLFGYVLHDPVNRTDPRGTGPIELFSCLLGSDTPAADCLADEGDRLSHGALGDCENCKDPLWGVGSPFREAAPRFPSFDKCIGKSLNRAVNCCRDLCEDEANNGEPDQCPGDPDDDDPYNNECFDACMKVAYPLD